MTTNRQIVRKSRSLFIVGVIFQLYGCGGQTWIDPTIVAQSNVESTTSREAKGDIGLATSIQVVPLISETEDSALTPRATDVRLLIPHRTFDKDPESGALTLTFEDLDLSKVLNMKCVTEDAESRMPDWMTSLEGQLVRIRGFMKPTFEDKCLTQFVLVDDNHIYGIRPYEAYESILIEITTGAAVDRIAETQRIEVVGRFKINLQSDGGLVFGLYEIDDANVIEF